MINGNSNFVLRKSVRKVKRSQGDTQNCTSSVCLKPISSSNIQAQRKTLTSHFPRRGLKQIKKNQGNDSKSINSNSSELVIPSADQSLQIEFFKNSKRINQLIEKYNFSQKDIQNAFYMMSIQIACSDKKKKEEFLGEFLIKKGEMKKCTQICYRRQSQIENLINQRLEKLQNYICND